MNTQHQGAAHVAGGPSKPPLDSQSPWKHLGFCVGSALAHPTQKVVTEILPMFSVLTFPHIRRGCVGKCVGGRLCFSRMFCFA